MTVRVGGRAPGFVVRSQHGEDVTLDTFAGRPVLLVFYPFAFSGICSGELAALRDHRSTFEAAGVQLAAISCDPMFALRVFDDRDGLGFALLSDFWPHGAAARAYGCFDDDLGAALRHSFLLDGDAVVRWTVAHGAGEARDIDLHLGALDHLP